ncbi:MAG: WG repeat-containing protein [Cyclobacteriaceae bacterium]|nr:WG repeat-containing protein [Cyclobacteriaceae bacterium]
MKELENLKKDGITDSVLFNQKKAVEFHAYNRARNRHTISDYDYFLSRFQGASQADSAVAYRNEIAFEDAREVNTYESYQDFIRRYPQAVQVEAAKVHYEELLYLSRTEDHRLESYIRFIRNNPTSPHSVDAERNILEISTAAHDLDSYMTFLELYPRSPWRKKAMNFMYHVYKQYSSAEGFSNKYGITSEKDSLLKIASADIGSLITIFEMEKYGFSRHDGLKLIDFTYSSVNEKYLCGNIRQDHLEVALDTQKLIVSRLGGIIYRGDYDVVEDLGYGALKVGKDGRYAVVHKSGVMITGFDFEDAGVVAQSFISYKENGRWGLRTFTNREILPAEYDAIESAGRFIVIGKDGLFAIQSIANLAAIANQKQVQPEFIYDDFELIHNNQLLLFKGEQETVMNLDLSIKIPLGNQNFYVLSDGWMVRKDGKYRFYDQIFYPLSQQEFNMVDVGKARVAMRYHNKWGIFNTDKLFPTTFEYDSVHFLSDQIGITRQGNATYAVFDNDSLVDISNSTETRLLRPSNISLTDENKHAQYLLTKASKGIYKVFDINGQKIIDGKYSNIEALGMEYLVVERDGKKGLFLQNGKEGLKVRYDAIGNYDRGYVSTLIDGKFGIFNASLSVTLSAKYQKALKPFGTKYFIGVKGNLLGLVDLDNKEVTKYEFEEILDWNDSIALVRKTGEWALFHVARGEYIYQGITEYKVLRDGTDKLLLVTRNGQLGVLSNVYGVIIGATFNDIINIGSAEQPVFFAEKYIREAEFYIVIYYDERGKILRKQIFTEPEEYEKIYCG